MLIFERLWCSLSEQGRRTWCIRTIGARGEFPRLVPPRCLRPPCGSKTFVPFTVFTIHSYLCGASLKLQTFLDRLSHRLQLVAHADLQAEL